MEFGKSKTTRFPLEPRESTASLPKAGIINKLNRNLVSAIPAANELGPGSYNIASPDVPYKHGAMLERAGRFKEGIQGTGTTFIVFGR